MDGQLDINRSKPEVNSPAVNIYDKLSTIKVVILGALWFGASLFLGIQISILSYVSEGIMTADFKDLGISLGLFLMLLVLNFILIPKKDILYFVTTIASLGFLLGFWDNIRYEVAVSWFFLWLGLIVSAYDTKRHMDKTLEVRFVSTSNMVLRKAILVLGIVTALIFYGIFYSAPLGDNNPILPKSVFEKSTEKISKIAGSVLGDVDFSKSLNEIASKNVSELAKQQNIVLTSEQEKYLTEKTVLEYQKKLYGIFGKTVDPNEPLSSAIYNLLLSKFNNMNESHRSIILGMLSLLLLLSIQAVSPIIRLVVVLLSWLIYEILKVLGFLVVVYEQRSKETIILP